MRVALLQFDPIFKDPLQSIKIATALLNKLKTKPDVIVLPEMSFTGYCFTSKQDIKNHIETNTGISLNWAKEQALKFKSFIQFGHPRISNNLYYNSTTLVNPKGELVYTYDKHFLYYQGNKN
jgi:protein N-terminal amidase